MKKWAVSLAVFGLGVLSGAVIYVSPAGSHKNTGLTPDSPLKSITKAFSMAKSGDTILLKGGYYHELPAGAWAEKNAKPITLKAFPDETPVITWGWDVKNWKKLPNGLWQADCPYSVCDLWQRITLDRYLKVTTLEMLKRQPGAFWQDSANGKIYVNPLAGLWHDDPESAGFTAVPFADGTKPASFKSKSTRRSPGMSIVGHNIHIEDVAFEFHTGKAFYLRGRQLDKFYGSGSLRNCSSVGATCGLSTGWYVDGVVIENCRAIRNSGAGIHLGNNMKNVKLINNFLLNNGSSLPFYGNYTAGGGNVYNLARYGGNESEYVDVIGNKVISTDKSRGGGVMRFKGGIAKHTNQMNNLFVGGGVVLYSVPGSTATIKNNTVYPGKFNFTVPNSGKKYTPDMKDNLEIRDSKTQKKARFVNPEKYDYRLLPDSANLGQGYAPQAAPVWFVKPDFQGGNGRTPEKPANSLAEIQKNLKSHDTVYFLKGSYTGTLTLKNLNGVTLSDMSFNTASWTDFNLVFENCSNIRVENMDFKGGKITLRNSTVEFSENRFDQVKFSAAGKKIILANNRLENSSFKGSGRAVIRENIISRFSVECKELVSEHNGFMTAQELAAWPCKETFKSFVAGVNGVVPLKNMVKGTRGKWIGSRVIPDKKSALEVAYANITPLSCGTKAVISWNTPKDYTEATVSVWQGKKKIYTDRLRFGAYLSCTNELCIPGLKPGTQYKADLLLARHNENVSWKKQLTFTTHKAAAPTATKTIEVGPDKKITSVATAVRSANSGDTILVHPGYYPEMINVHADNITIKAAIPGTVKFSSEYMFDYVIRAANVKGLTIEGIDFVGLRYSSGTHVVYVLKSENVKIRNCRFHAGAERRMGNLHIFGRYVNGFEVKNCVFDTGFHSLWLYESDNVTVDHNTFWGIGINAMHIAGGKNAKVTITNNLMQDVVANHNSPAISVGHPETNLVCDWNLYWSTQKCPKQKVFGLGGKIGIYAVGQVMQQDALVTIEECRKRFGVEKNGLFADPGMIDPEQGDFRLAPASPARKRGSDGKDIGADFTIWSK